MNVERDKFLTGKMNLLSLSGIPIYQSPYVVTKQQYRFPRSKKKRIQKKWARDDNNFKSAPGAVMYNGHTMIAHPDVINKLRIFMNSAALAEFLREIK